MLFERAYDGATDLQRMIDLLLTVRPPDRIADRPGVVELQEAMERPAVSTNTRLWSDGVQLLAWAYVDEWTNLHPMRSTQQQRYFGPRSAQTT